jgi:serine/threonine-protein kinase
MAAVYVARDEKHDRLVALKVFSRELSTATDRARFLREVQISARLQHPHLCPIFDSGETNGQLWFTMPLVTGDSLRARLEQNARPPLAFVRRVIRESAQGLAAAHAAGVVHRDVKPENLLLGTDDAVLVADFGIARGALAVEPDHRLTATGMVLGTPAYMSPEQLDRPETLTPAADQYALALVAYEMLAGRHPFAGPDGRPPGLLRSLETPVPLTTHRADLGPAVSTVLARALATVPHERFGTIEAFADAFEQALAGGTERPGQAGRPALRLPYVAIGGIALLGALVAVLTRPTTRPESAAPARIAVLPFDAVGDVPDTAIADAVSEGIRNRLALTNDVEVLARQTSTAVASELRGATSVGSIAKSLDITYFLSGTVRWSRADSQLVITPSLVQVVDGRDRQIGLEAVVGRTTDVFRLQELTAQRVARTLNATLSGTADSARSVGTQNLDAFDAFVRGEKHSDQGVIVDAARLRLADAEYAQAVDLDRAFGLAWARLAWTRAFLLALGEPVDTPLVQATVDSASVHAPDNPFTFIAASMAARNTGHSPEALRIALEGVRRFPRNAAILAQTSTVLQMQGALDSALQYFERARRNDPREPAMLVRGARLALVMHRFALADTLVRMHLQISPASLGVYLLRIDAALGAGDTLAARRVIEEGLADAGQAWRKTATILLSGAGLWVAPVPVAQRLLDELAQGRAPDDPTLLSLRLAFHAAHGDTAAVRRAGQTFLEVARRRGRPIRSALFAAYTGDCALARTLWTPALTDSLADNAEERAGRFYQLAIAASWCGDAGAAITFLERLVRMPGPYSGRWIAVDPHFARWRGVSRFVTLTNIP